MLNAARKKSTNIMTSCGFSMCSVNLGGMKKKFHTRAQSAAIISTGPRLQRRPASTMAIRKASAENMYPVSGSTSLSR